ncbi:hypothetical protein HMI55_006447 [Coelomomyces lativittatus]|nr:hypothetical protein HMI55_006447 [Coelomomyces lativittatus]
MLCWSWTHPHVWTTDIDPFIMKCVGSCLFTLQTSGEDQDFTQPVQKDEGLDTYTWWRTLKTLPSRSFFLELPGLNRPCPCVMALPVMHPLDLPNLGFRSSALSFGRGMVPKLGLDGHDKGGSVIDPLPSRPPSSCLLPLSLLPTPFWWLDPLWTTTSDLPNERGIPVVNERAQKLPLNALRSPFLIPLNASFRHQVIQAAHFAAAAYDKNQTRLTSWQCEKCSYLPWFSTSNTTQIHLWTTSSRVSRSPWTPSKDEETWGYLLLHPDWCVLAFKGATTLPLQRRLVSDLLFQRTTPYTFVFNQTHSTFPVLDTVVDRFRAFQDTWVHQWIPSIHRFYNASVSSQRKGPSKIWVVGHSMGGCLATLTALSLLNLPFFPSVLPSSSTSPGLKTIYVPTVDLFLFNTPKFSTQALLTTLSHPFLASHLHPYNLLNLLDPIPKFPFPSLTQTKHKKASSTTTPTPTPTSFFQLIAPTLLWMLQTDIAMCPTPPSPTPSPTPSSQGRRYRQPLFPSSSSTASSWWVRDPSTKHPPLSNEDQTKVDCHALIVYTPSWKSLRKIQRHHNEFLNQPHFFGTSGNNPIDSSMEKKKKDE